MVLLPRRVSILHGHLVVRGKEAPWRSLQPQPAAAVGTPTAAAGYGDSEVAGAAEAEAFRRYCEEAKARALQLGNRGPIRFDKDGRLAKDILDAYWAVGFYVFEGVVTGEELREIQNEFEEIHDNRPAKSGSPVDRFGRPTRFPANQYMIDTPLSDPFGGGPVGGYNFRENKPGAPRHHIGMRKPQRPANAPETVMSYLHNPLAKMDSVLRFYGTAKVLKVVEAVNGPDFTPSFEHVLHKPAGLGASTAWHQDPSEAWDEDWKQGKLALGQCGMNMHLSLYNTTPESALWMVPGTHHNGRIDVKALSAKQAGGTDLLPGAVPILCGPGDIYLQNRMALHGAFPNVGPEPRVSIQFGFAPRSSVLGVRTKPPSPIGGSPDGLVTYDDAWIRERSVMIPLAIDSRKQKYPNEESYEYLPFRGVEVKWSEELKQDPSYINYFDKSIFI